MGTKRNAKNRLRTPASAQNKHRLFLCVVSGDEKNREEDVCLSFQVLIPANGIDEVPELLEQHLKRLRREGTMLSADSALTLYLDHIYEFVRPLSIPLTINYRQRTAIGACAEIGNYMPEDSEGAVEGYGWSADDVPPPESETEEVKPFLTFKSRDGKTTMDLAVDPVAADSRRIRGKLSSCGWKDRSKKNAVELRLERQTITLALTHPATMSNHTFDIEIRHKEKNKNFPPLKYLVDYKDRLDRILECLVDLSRDIEATNIREHLREMHRSSSEMFVYGKKGPIGLRELGERF